MSMPTLLRPPFRARPLALLAVALMLLAPLGSAQLGPLLPAPPIAAAQSSDPAGPQPGDVFRQFQDNAASQTGVCNSSPTNCGTVPSVQSRSAANVALTDATRAEAVFEFWGGHPGSTDQDFSVNNGPWTPYPDIQNIPADSLPTCYLRTLTNAIAPLPLSGSGGVRPTGNNNSTVTVGYRYRIGSQEPLTECAPGTNDDWGNMWVYEVTTRIYYNPALTGHPGGTISPPAGGVLSENLSAGQFPTISVNAQARAGTTISRVDLIGNYLDYDWDGDGIFSEWQYALRRGVWEQTIGTRTSPSSGTNTNGVYSFTWNTTWLPDQPRPVQLMARITDSSGVSYMTPIVEAPFSRSGRSVRMYTTWSDYFGQRVPGPPRNWGMNVYQKPRSGKVTNMSIPDPLTNATRAHFVLYSWSGNPGYEDMNGDGISDTDNARTEVWVNSREIWPNQRFGIYHNYSFDSKDFTDPQAFLRQGDNDLLIWSNRPNHKLEVLWPGPAIFVEFSAPPTTPALTATNTTLSTPEDQPLAITLPVSNPAGAALSYSILTQPSRGALSGEAPQLTYTPQPDANGSDSFSFKVTDQYQRSASATVTVNIQPVADAPTIFLGEGALLAPGDTFTRSGTLSAPDGGQLTASVDYGDGTGSFPLSVGAGSFQLSHTYAIGGRFTLTVSVSDGARTGTAQAIINVVTPNSPPPTDSWALGGWRYRLPLSAGAGAYPRHDRVAEFDVNFTSALQQAGGSGPLIPESIRVVEVDASGAVLDPNVTYEFNPTASGYNATANARGALLVLMKGDTAAGASRSYQVYFETRGSFKAPSFTPLVSVTNPLLYGYNKDKVTVVETHDSSGPRNTTYYYSRNGGALASLVDRNNADWISYSTKADSLGSYRGLPNLGAVFHPGYFDTYPSGKGNDLGSGQGSTTTIIHEGPLHTILRSVSSNGQWEATWEIFPQTTRMTVVRAPAVNYWWLYEGTPGGTIDPTDRWVRADGQAKNAYDAAFTYQERYHSDINGQGPEWVYFRAGEAALGGRALWLANHDDSDQKMDMYRQQNDGSGTAQAMGVMGFGRREYTDTGSQTLQQELSGTPKQFSIGFIENAPSSFDANTGLAIEGAYRNLQLGVGQGEGVLSNLAPWAGNDHYRARPNTTLQVAAPGVTANDNDGDGDPVTIELSSEPLHGTLSFAADGSFSYTPAAGFVGEDSFTYTASDGKNAAPAATVTIVVAPNVAPTAVASSGETPSTAPLVVAAPGVLQGASDADSDPLTAVLVAGPAHGQLTLNPNGAYIYTPDQGFVGDDSFTIAASDGLDQSAPTKVTIKVTQPAPAPGSGVFLPLLAR